MTQTTMDKALLATARVACCTSLFGLGCTDSINHLDSAEVTLEECDDLVQETVLASGRMNSDVKECCQRIAESYGDLLEGMDEWEERDECCAALDWQGSMACTPWGPPTPPTALS